MGDITGNEALGELFRGVVAETASLGRAKGVALPDDLEERIWKGACALPAPMRASTAIDLEKGRPLEIEWISGAVKRLAKDVGLSVPHNETLHALLSIYRDGG
jgi:2-dehydropantoate 2-reductase